MAEEHGLSEDESRTLLPSGRQTTIANRTHWALAYLNKAGLITRISRGQYEASARGRELLEQPPTRLTIAYLQRYPEFATFRTEVGKPDRGATKASIVQNGEVDVQSSTPEERLEAAARDLKAEVAASLLTRL